MNKILKLLDEEFTTVYLRKKVLPFYPEHSAITKIKIKPHKKMIWDKTYHVVFEYTVQFENEENVTIFVAAHSDEPRWRAFNSLKILESNGFDNQDELLIPRPLFYSRQFNGFFYQGIEGKNLYHFIKEHNFILLERELPRAAAWFAKLHCIKLNKDIKIENENNTIATVIPGVTHILKKVAEKYPDHIQDVKFIYDCMIRQEENFLTKVQEKWLVHGDAHPENIIVSERGLGVIDFADLCLGDFARDIGTFLAQVEYMASKKIEDQAYIEKMKGIFLANYLKFAKIKMTDSLQERINLYQNWTMMRIVSVFLLRENPSPEKAIIIIKKVKGHLLQSPS